MVDGYWEILSLKLSRREYPWLESAYFARIDDLRGVLGELGMTLNSQQITPVTWVLWSSKG